MTQREQAVNRHEQTPAATAFDELHTRHAAALHRQAYLLTGRPRLAQRAVERGFHRAWQRWPEVAVDADPAGWVRAAVYAYALTPWHRLCPRLRTAGQPQEIPESVGAGDRELLEVVLGLPAPYRQALLLHDGVGLGLCATAAEAEASVPAAAGRLAYARERIAERLPELGLGGQSPERQGEILRDRLGALLAAQEAEPPGAPDVRAPGVRAPDVRAPDVRAGSERGARRATRAVFGLTGLFAVVTLLVAIISPDHYAGPHREPLATGTAPATPAKVRQARLSPDIR